MVGISDASTSRGLKEKPSPRGDPAPLPRGPAHEKEKPLLRGGPAPRLKHFSPLPADPAPRMKHYSPTRGGPAPRLKHYSPTRGGPAPRLKYFSPTHTQNGRFSAIFTVLGRYFFHRGTLNDRPALRRGDHSFMQPLRGHSESPRRCLAAVPVGGGGAWPDNEATRRAKLAARTARGRAAAHGHTKQPGPPTHHTAPGTPAAQHAT